jgi:hypothetical protein
MSMWSLRNQTLYKVGKTWGRTQDGVPEWIVAVKATYDVHEDGAVSLAAEQVEPLLAPEYTGEDGASSLRYDADLVGEKPTTDIIVNGTAYAPQGRPSTEFLVAMRVGPVRKVLRVRGPRRWGDNGDDASSPETVTRVPLAYERAYGGYDNADPDPKNQRLDTRNPVGCGVVADPRRRAGRLLPSFEYPDGNPEDTGPAGFGPIDCFWSPRRELHGTYDAAWERDRKPLFPTDWNQRSRLCSPADQQPKSHLHGGDIVELTNLTPGGRLEFQLPRAHIGFSTLIGKRTVEHRGQLSTIIIEPDRFRVLMVWVTALPCPTDMDYLEETVVREKELLR